MRINDLAILAKILEFYKNILKNSKDHYLDFQIPYHIFYTFAIPYVRKNFSINTDLYV